MATKKTTLKVNLLISFMFGFFLFVGIAIYYSQTTATINAKAFLLLVLAMFFGFVLRILRRKVFFATEISLHRSFSYEAIVQTIQLISPFFPRRAFEAEFLEGEGQIPPQKVTLWLSSRALSSILVAILCVLVILSIFYVSYFYLFAIFAGTCFVLLCLHVWKDFSLRFFLTLLGSSSIWVVEGAFFCFAAKECQIGMREALAFYILFTGFYELSPSPFALGTAELPLLIFGEKFFSLAICFHIIRAFPTFLLGFLYLSRYKFSILDFFNPDLVDVLAKRNEKLGDTSKKESPLEKVAIVIPAFNEEKRIEPFLNSVVNYAKKHDSISSIVVVDDGSTDKTKEIIIKISKQSNIIKALFNENNRGKGFSVRRGVLFALDADVIIYADADGATPIEELDSLLEALRNGAKIAIGSRKSPKAERSGLRAILGGIFYKIVNLLAIPGIDDSQCGFKMFTREAAEKIFSRSVEDAWAFDVEVLYIAQFFGYKIAQIPVRWTEKKGSKVSLLRDSLKMLIAVFRIRSRHGGIMKDA